MATANFRLVFELAKTRDRGIVVLSVRYPGQPSKNYFSYHKQSLQHHPNWLANKINLLHRDFTNHQEVTISMTAIQFREYYSTQTNKFVFRGSVLKSEQEESKMLLTAEQRMKDATARRVATRKANKAKRMEQNDEDVNNSVLEQIKALFSSSSMES